MRVTISRNTFDEFEQFAKDKYVADCKYNRDGTVSFDVDDDIYNEMTKGGKKFEEALIKLMRK